jgi:hypothetical protein
MIATTAGAYRFTDAIGGAPQRVDVVLDGGELCARFLDDEGDVELVPVADMQGTWARA